MTLMCALSLFAVDFKIEIPAQPKPQETTAKEELEKYLARRVSDRLTIEGKGNVVFHVGDTAFAHGKHLLSTEIEDERWIVKSFGNNVILNGGGTRGVLYAVYHFLEEQCDIHWWSETEEFVPLAGALNLKSLDMSGRPFFRYRNIYRGLKGTPSRTRFMIRAGLNSDSDNKIQKEFGGSFNYGAPAHAHTFDSYIPYKEYKDTHPEYFSLRNGRRIGGQFEGQLCLTNPDIKAIVVKRLMENIEKGYAEAAKSGMQPPLLYDISQNDNQNPCECERCKAANEQYNPSGVYIGFINSIAEEIAKKYPDIYITTLAYHYTELPPKGGVAVRDNVIVKLTNTKTNKAASMLAPQNSYFPEVVREWSKICKNILIWEYAITFNKSLIGMPYASEMYYGEMFKFYAENNVMGIVMEHEYPERTDMFEYKFFLEAKLMDNPYQDCEKLSALFLEKYYGKAAPFMRKFRETIDAAAQKADAQLRWTRNLDHFVFLTEETLLKCHKLFDDATEAVKDDKLLVERVMRARNGLDRLTCMRTSGLIYHGPKKPSTSRLNGAEAFKRLDAHWPEWCQRYEDYKTWKNPITDALNQFRFFFNPPPVPKQFENRNYYEFVAVCSARGDYDYKNVWAADEPDSAVGRGYRIYVPGDNHYDMPFAMGLYDKKKKQTIAKATFDKIPEDRGYNWFCLGAPVVIPEDGMLYITRAWTIQMHFNGMDEIIGKPFEIWISARHQGKQFHPYQGTGGDRIIVDRILLVEPQETK